jgi:hypothetical protein
VNVDSRPIWVQVCETDVCYRVTISYKTLFSSKQVLERWACSLIQQDCLKELGDEDFYCIAVYFLLKRINIIYTYYLNAI